MATPNTKHMFGNAYVGIGIRRTIGKTTTFRLRRGNGFYGSVEGRLYQDKYAYTNHDPTASTCPVAAKNCFAAGVAAWQALSTEAKALWKKKASTKKGLFGYHLFLRNYMLENYP